ncbi:hyaluronan and proteoglycan link protein 4-like [Xiphophorus maculatus]|uniref:hyaluronan and proteoglycan link protein 4-like n=1 Tax=Xiphophorus maculatus TaxID=8083 RepID=UPI000C6E1D2C|nr:hyaluronan and proteoglycan link protein 4-like [Xiphophorus maculatus]
MTLNFGRRNRPNQEMASLTDSLFLLSVVFWQFVAAADPVSVKAKAGAVVTLPCKFAGAKAVVLAEWSRPDQTLAPVLLYRNKKVDDNQLAAYKGRTSLLAAEKGDLSLVLKKVVGRDTGKYECRVLLEGSGDEEEELEIEQPRSGGRGGRSGTFLTSDPISIVMLKVEGGPRPGGDVQLRPNTVLPVGLLALLALIAGLL